MATSESGDTVWMSTYNDAVWQCLKLYLPPGTRLTSVYRSDEHQLAIIIRRAKAHGYQFTKTPVLSDPSTWMDAWRLAKTNKDPIAKPGTSLHRLAKAYDMTGQDLAKIETAVKKAAADGRIVLAPPRPNWPNPRLEGHCVHAEILGGAIDFEPFDFA
jgi:hypothetical protein